MEHDSAWKEVLENLFERFLSFFFPNIHKDIDFSRGFEFLDNELQQIAVESESGKRIVDKLVKVYLLDGSEQWLLIHIEIQGYEQTEFPERMYVYNYRIFDKFRREVISLALLTDENPNFRPNEYSRSRRDWGFEVLCRFPVVKLIDYREQWAELEANPHPFAIIVRAYLKALEIVGNVQEKYSWKKHFLLELYQAGMDRETLWVIYKFIDWMIRLPKELNKAFVTEMKTIEEAKQMSLITSAEEVGLEKGINSLQRVVAKTIKRKFGALGQQLAERAHKINRLEVLEDLSEKLWDVQNLTEAEKIFDEIELSAKLN
ncbi:hypothetical protein L0337_21995 [candidate division KSB1 bacterium]|nr:hypothetical protein [candidate division KSB1 bacterium]